MDKLGEVLLYIVRHCEVGLDSERKIRGLQNESLNETGEEQSKELAEFFANLPISAVYSDDLERSYHTAIVIAHTHDLEVTQDIALRSWDLGELEGRSIDANEGTIKELKMQPDKVPVGGQSWRDFEDQIKSAFSKYASMAMSASGPIVLVLHGSGIQVIWNCIGAMDKSADYDATPLDTSGVATISAARDGYRAKILRGAKELADA